MFSYLIFKIIIIRLNYWVTIVKLKLFLFRIGTGKLVFWKIFVVHASEVLPTLNFIVLHTYLLTLEYQNNSSSVFIAWIAHLFGNKWNLLIIHVILLDTWLGEIQSCDVQLIFAYCQDKNHFILLKILQARTCVFSITHHFLYVNCRLYSSLLHTSMLFK